MFRDIWQGVGVLQLHSFSLNQKPHREGYFIFLKKAGRSPRYDLLWIWSVGLCLTVYYGLNGVAGCAGKDSKGTSALASCRGVLMHEQCLPWACPRKRKPRRDVIAVLNSHLLFYSQGEVMRLSPALR